RSCARCRPRSTPFPYTTLFRSERQGDPAKGIPEWSGGLARPPAGYGGPGSFHVDPFAGEQPLRVIDAQNMGADEANLSPGVKARSEEHTSELQSREKLVCRLLL